MPSADDSLNPLVPAGVPSEPWAEIFRGQSQLDFDLAFYQRVLQRDPDYVDVLRCQGALLSRKGLHERALSIDRHLAELRPDDETVSYNLACSLAQVNRPAEAIAALRRALALGYADFRHLDMDRDLESLRDNPAFIALLNEYQNPAA